MIAAFVSAPQLTFESSDGVVDQGRAVTTLRPGDIGEAVGPALGELPGDPVLAVGQNTYAETASGGEKLEARCPLLHAIEHQRRIEAQRLEGADGKAKDLIIGLATGNDRDAGGEMAVRSEEHTSELQSRFDLVCRLL